LSDIGWHINSIPVLGTEPASENRIRSCCGSTPGIRFYCKPVTLVRCREIRGENRFSGRVGGKWLCEMTSAFIIKELRGARALRLFCGRSAFPPPIPKIPTLIGWDFFCPFPQCWRGFRAWPRERHPCEVGAFGPADASLFSVFSGGHASVLEAISFAGAGLEAVGCGWQLL